MIKRIDDNVYIGGKNSLKRYKLNGNQLNFDVEREYVWPHGIINGSGICLNLTAQQRPTNFSIGSQCFTFDSCLNWKKEHPNASVREEYYEFHRYYYHTPAGNFDVMGFTCMNSFIKSVEKYTDSELWVCGTFGTYPRAFSVKLSTLEFVKFLDVNMMTCSRFIDEPMATYNDSNGNLYIGSGWGLYRPDKISPDSYTSRSAMMYSDWRLFGNLFTLPAAFAWVLSSDVNFINVVKETASHLYFFGYEVNSQYGLNNQYDRNAWQSFMVRICKDDPGHPYIPDEYLLALRNTYAIEYTHILFKPPLHNETDHLRVSMAYINGAYQPGWYEKLIHLPRYHFVTPLKINFGCYLSRRVRGITDNHFWGDTNVVYINKLADVIYDPNRRINFRSSTSEAPFACNNTAIHSQIPLVGIFNKEGISDTQIKPTGALCQLQLNENVFNEIGSKKKTYSKHDLLKSGNAYEEQMAISSTTVSNEFAKVMHRTLGYSSVPFWNQGIGIGHIIGHEFGYLQAFDNVGKCNSPAFYKTLSNDTFRAILNFSNTAWPNELPNLLTSAPSACCQYTSAELYGFNATFVVEGVQFKKMFLIKDNITNFNRHNVKGEIYEASPLMIVAILSDCGRLYRVVLCDFDNGMINNGEDMTTNKWYNWCIFRFTDQPYIYRQYTPMERRDRGPSYLFRASSLLMEKTVVNKADQMSYPINKDSQYRVVKDAIRNGDYLHVLTAKNIHLVNLQIICEQNYTTCISCASDPECMWDVEKKKCVSYSVDDYKESVFVQDVLDRGFRCAKHIKVENENIRMGIEFHQSKTLTVKCLNAEFWPDKVQWRINNLEIETVPKKYMINTKENYLVLLDNEKTIHTISCHGVRADNDLLYNNVDYDWIKDLKLPVTLNIYTNSGGPPYSVLLAFFIIFIFLLIGLLVAAVLLYIFWQPVLIFFNAKFPAQRNVSHSVKEEQSLVEQSSSSPLTATII